RGGDQNCRHAQAPPSLGAMPEAERGHTPRIGHSWGNIRNRKHLHLRHRGIRLRITRRCFRLVLTRPILAAESMPAFRFRYATPSIVHQTCPPMAGFRPAPHFSILNPLPLFLTSHSATPPPPRCVFPAFPLHSHRIMDADRSKQLA